MFLDSLYLYGSIPDCMGMYPPFEVSIPGSNVWTHHLKIDMLLLQYYVNVERKQIGMVSVDWPVHALTWNL